MKTDYNRVPMISMSLLKSRSFRIVSISVMLCFVVLLGTPILARYLAQQWLLDNGGEEVLFEDVDLNLFTGNLVMQGLEVKVDTETTLYFDYVGLDLEWWPLERQQVEVQSLQLKGFRLVIDNRESEAMRIGGIRLPRNTPDNEPQAKESDAWLSGIEELTLQDFHILIRDPKFELGVTLDHLSLTRIAQWTPEQAATLELAGKINGAPVQVSGQIAPFAEQPRYELDLSIEKLQLDAFSKLVSPPFEQLSGMLSHTGELTFEQSKTGIKLNQDGESTVESLQLVLGESGLEASIGQFFYKGKLVFEQSEATINLSEEGAIAVASLRLIMGEAGIETTLDQFSHDGKLILEQSAADLKLNQDGKSKVESLTLTLDKQGLETSIGQFVHNGKFGFEQSSSTISLHEDGEILVDSLSLALSEPEFETAIDQFSHSGQIAFEQSGEMVSLEQDGDVSVDSLDVSLHQPDLEVHNGKLQVTARLNYSGSPSGNHMQLASDMTLENLDIDASERKVNLLSAEALKIEELLLEDVDQISIKSISLDQIQIGKVSDEDAEKPQSLARSEKLQIAGLSRTGNLVAIDEITHEGFHNRMVRDKDGNMEVLRFIDIIEHLNTPVATNEPGPEAVPKAGDKEGQAEPIDLAIASILGSKGSSVTFIDEMVKPSFAATVVFEEFSLKQLDTRKPEQKSPLRLKAALGKYTRLSANGDVKPFLKPFSVDLVGQIQALDLLPFSSYSRESLGLQLNSGTLDADLKFASTDEVLNGSIELVLHQLELGEVESESGLQSKIPVPMDTALSTLRDENNTIKLTIPVEGNMNDPKFDVSDAINQALATGLQAGALSYLQLALQPFGTLITAVQYAGEAVSKVQLDPVEFEAGQATITATGEEYLEKVAKIMQERPEIDIKLCGVAVQQDQIFFQNQQDQEDQEDQQDLTAVGDLASGQSAQTIPAMDEQKLTDLGMLRETGVKDYLIEKHQIPASRLVGCRSRIETDPPDAKPRLDLLI